MMVTKAMVAEQLNVTCERLRRAVEGITEQEARRVLEGRLAPIVWQVGHVAVIDAAFVQRGGGSTAVGPRYPELFKQGTGGAADYPPLAEVWGVFSSVHQGLLAVAAEAEYTKPLESPTRVFTNVGEMLIFACYHRGYHVGKTATLRALLGKPLPGLPPARPA